MAYIRWISCIFLVNHYVVIILVVDAINFFLFIFFDTSTLFVSSSIRIADSPKEYAPTLIGIKTINNRIIKYLFNMYHLNNCMNKCKIKALLFWSTFISTYFLNGFLISNLLISSVFALYDPVYFAFDNKDTTLSISL